MPVPTGEALTSTIPDSPFLPGTSLQYAWDSVSLTCAMACWRRYKYRMLDGLVPKNPNRAIALDFGIAFHKALEHYHNAKATWPELGHHEWLEVVVSKMPAEPTYARLPTQAEVDALSDGTEDDDDGITLRNSKPRTRYHLMRAVVWYLEHYADDQAKTVLLPSGAPAVEVSFRLELDAQIGGEAAILCGHIDRVVSFNDHLYVADYKTTKALSRQFFDDFELSHQITGYTLAGQVIMHKPVSGNIIDGIALQMGAVQFQRRIADRTPSQFAEYTETVQDVFDRAERHHDSGHYPMNTSACYFCEYKGLCKEAPEYRPSYEKMLFEKINPWNPLENR